MGARKQCSAPPTKYNTLSSERRWGRGSSALHLQLNTILSVLRGDGGEEAVLCTSNKTYTVRECTTSNSLLLTPDLVADTDNSSHTITPRRVASCNFVYYEVRFSVICSLFLCLLDISMIKDFSFH